MGLAKVDLAGVENDIEYLLFVDHAESMEGYTHLKPIISEIAKLVQIHADSAVEQYQNDIIPTIAARLQDEVATIVFGEKQQPIQREQHDTEEKGALAW